MSFIDIESPQKNFQSERSSLTSKILDKENNNQRFQRAQNGSGDSYVTSLKVYFHA